MYVEFKKLRFKNILSYGNSLTEFSFDKGINLIHAANGSGKSTILDAMTFCLFGKPYRDIKLAELVNLTNKKDLYTEIEFNINKDSYKICRGYKPATFQIFKNNVELDLLSSKKLNQEEIDKLLGINQRLFKNIVCIAVTNNKPFLALPIGEKRALMENIFNIDVLGLMCKDVKKRKTLNVNEQAIKINELSSVNNSINDTNKYIQNMQTYIQEFNNTKQAEINRIQGLIDTNNNTLSKAEKNVSIGQSALDKKLNELGDAPDSTIYGQISKDIGKAEADKVRLEKTLNGLSTKSECPICGSPLNEGHAAAHIKSLNKELKTIIEKTIPSLQKKLNDFNTKQTEYNTKAELINNIKKKLEIEKQSVIQSQNNINNLNESLVAAQNKECNISLTEYIDKIETLKQNVNTITDLIDELQHKIDIDNTLTEVLGDAGVKQYFFKKLVLILNKHVNDYLKKFEMPVQILFDDQMQEVITKGKDEMSYNQFSGGERCRIDMSILLSFFNVSRIISNWSCNLLILDEIIDGGVDQSGIDQFLATLYNMLNENNKKKIGIYIVSHKLTEPKVQINHIININKKPGGFSTLEVK